MSESIAQPSPDSHAPVGHEATDASAYYVSLFALALAIAIVLSLLFLYRMFWRLEARAQRADPVERPASGPQIISEPRLQVDPRAELAQLREAEEQSLQSYQWIDEQQGIVQIPIQRAIEVLCERGLPEPRAAAPATVAPEAAP